MCLPTIRQQPLLLIFWVLKKGWKVEKGVYGIVLYVCVPLPKKEREKDHTLRTIIQTPPSKQRSFIAKVCSVTPYQWILKVPPGLGNGIDVFILYYNGFLFLFPSLFISQITITLSLAHGQASTYLYRNDILHY